MSSLVHNINPLMHISVNINNNTVQLSTVLFILYYRICDNIHDQHYHFSKVESTAILNLIN